MAELIPMDYRIRSAIKQRIRRWVLAGGLTLSLAALAVSSALVAERRTAKTADDCENTYRSRSSLIAKSDELKAKRQIIAERMQKIQQLQDDRVLVALLQQISNGFSSNDCLEYLHIDARGVAHKDSPAGADDQYSVRLSGMTNNTSTLAQLMARLGSSDAKMPVSVMLERSMRENVLDGQVVKFQVTCEKNKGSDNSAG